MNPLTQIKNTQKATFSEISRGVADSASWHAKFRHSAYVFTGGLAYDLTEGIARKYRSASAGVAAEIALLFPYSFIKCELAHFVNAASCIVLILNVNLVWTLPPRA
jgi:hypothetical protein